MDNNQTETRALAVASIDTGRISAGNLMLDIPVMESLMRVADLMASGKSTVPKHLQGNAGDCMAVCMQSMQWGMNPFAVAQKTHLVNGTLGYEAQLVNAVLQSMGAIEGDFSYEFKGAGVSLECRVGAVARGAKEITWGEWLNISLVTTKNSPLWKTNPKQQMGYLQVKNWARAFKPAALLGVYTPDELELRAPRDMGPVEPVTADNSLLQAAQNAANEGVATYSEFWKKAGAEARKAIGAAEHERLKNDATNADKARTLDNKAKTFDEVMASLCAATDEDTLYAASDNINAIETEEEQAVLNAKFDERLAEMRGAA